MMPMPEHGASSSTASARTSAAPAVGRDRRQRRVATLRARPRARVRPIRAAILAASRSTHDYAAAARLCAPRSAAFCCRARCTIRAPSSPGCGASRSTGIAAASPCTTSGPPDRSLRRCRRRAAFRRRSGERLRRQSARLELGAHGIEHRRATCRRAPLRCGALLTPPSAVCARSASAARYCAASHVGTEYACRDSPRQLANSARCGPQRAVGLHAAQHRVDEAGRSFVTVVPRKIDGLRNRRIVRQRRT